jgi:hypothetical protein
LTAAAQAESPSYAILHETDPFVPQARDFGQALDVLSQSQGQSVHMWVQVEEIGNLAWRENLSAEGIRLLNYVPNNAWIASVSTELTTTDFQRLGIRWVGPLRMEDKVSGRVLRGDEESPWADYAGGAKIYVIRFHEDVDFAVGKSILERYPHTPGSRIKALNAQIVAMDPGQVESLAMEEEVKWISILPPPLEGVNDGARAAIQVDTVHQAPYGLDGTGSNVLVYDVGLVDRNHPDFSPNRVTYGEGGGTANHGTHVGGTVGGNGTNNPNYKGMAPNTKITSYVYEACSPFCLYDSPWDMEENYEEGFTVHGADYATNSLGANIATNGYPCEWEGDYETTAQLLDTMVHGDWGPGRPFLSIWAAGNERQSPRCGDTYYTTGVPATAKNTIVVGATNSNNHSMAWFSSWGPVDDGRIRPDVCAPGCQQGGDGGITSTFPGGGYGTYCGTSMSAPATAGVAALILQEIRSSPFGAPRRLPSTMKALLIQTAQDYGNHGPDFQFGFGEIRAKDAIDHMRSGHALFEGVLDQGDERSYFFDVPEGQIVLKATVVWSDVPGEVLAEKELVNDIDAWFENPQGGIHRPWVLDHNSPADDAFWGEDHLNPVEQIEVFNPVAGEWVLHLRGHEIPEGPQTFSVAVNLGQSQGSASVEEQTLTGRARLFANQPNPFNPRTVIRFALAGEESQVSLKVYNASGRLVRTLEEGSFPVGQHQTEWDGRDNEGHAVPSGVYFYQLELSGETITRTMTLLK